MRYEVSNIIARFKVPMEIPLDKLAITIGGEYRRRRFPGMIVRVEDVATFILFRNGKIVAVGIRSFENLVKASEWIKNTLGLPRRPRPQIGNIVVTYYTDKRIHIDKLVEDLSLVYDPYSFPGAFLKLQSGVTSIIFANGKIIATGFKNQREIEEYGQWLEKLLSKYLLD